MEPLPKIFNRGSVLLSLFASLLALIKLDSKIISTFVGFGESLWRKEMLQEFEIKIQRNPVKEKQNIISAESEVYLSNLRQYHDTQ